jgi:hypothetical protein
VPYAAAIRPSDHAPKDVIEDIAPSFASAIARIRRCGDEWILESSSFEPFESNEKLKAAAQKLVSQMHSVLRLFMGLYREPLTVYAIVRTDEDRIIARHGCTSITVSIYASTKRVFPPNDCGSLATDVLSRAATDRELAEALSLVGHEAPTWGQVYDIIEFLGDAPSIAELGFASRKETILVRQTAAHHRHLGDPKKVPLPPTPQTLNEAVQFANRILKEWIAKTRVIAHLTRRPSPLSTDRRLHRAAQLLRQYPLLSLKLRIVCCVPRRPHIRASRHGDRMV